MCVKLNGNVNPATIIGTSMNSRYHRPDKTSQARGCAGSEDSSGVKPLRTFGDASVHSIIKWNGIELTKRAAKNRSEGLGYVTLQDSDVVVHSAPEQRD